MNSVPKISVIMPVYNGEKWLDESIPSVLNQTFTDFEFIIINDESKDNSLSILNKYAKADKRVKVFSNKNVGPGESLNFGMAQANGKYLCFIDQDDKYTDVYLEQMFCAVDSDGADMAVCYARAFDDKTKFSSKIAYPYFENGEFSQNDKQKMLNYFFPQWTKIIRRDFVKKHKITFPGRYNKVHDVPFHVLTLWFAKKIMIVNQELYLHRQHESQITHNLSDFCKTGIIVSVQDIEKYCKSQKIQSNDLMRFALGLIYFKGNFIQNMIIRRMRYKYDFKNAFIRFFYRKRIQNGYVHTRILFIKFKKKIKVNGLKLHVPKITNCGRCTYYASGLCVANSGQTVIGSFCSIGKNVSLGCGEHPTNFLSTSPYFYFDALNWKNKETQSYNNYWYYEPIVIGHDVWIGDNVFVKNGINIGNGAIIGACSVVTHDVPPYAIVAGVPAKIIRYRFDKKTIDKLQQLKWWNLPDDVIKEIPFDDIDKAINFIKGKLK